MVRVVALSDVEPDARVRDRVHTHLLRSSAEDQTLPTAFVSEQSPNRVIKPHYHIYNQWIYVLGGSGTLGRDKIGPGTAHFTRAFTPYGPLVSTSDQPLTTLVLYTRYQPGAQYLHQPGVKDRLREVKDRQPWQIKRHFEYPHEPGQPTVDLRAIPDVKDDNGLFASSLVLQPNAKTTAPSPENGDGQYIIVSKGSFLHDGKEYKGLSIVYLQPQDGAFAIQAGAEGLEAAILNFPHTGNTETAKKAAPSTTSHKWGCKLCGFVYDEADGYPSDKIAAGTRWEDVPEDFICPDCSVGKDEFELVEGD